jgi:cytochrome c-type biogenesis protein CcmH/NrfG
MLSSKEKAVDVFVKEELRHQVKFFLDEHEKRHRKWYILFASVLVIILGVMLYIGITFYKWDERWKQKAQKDKDAMEQYLKDRDEWKGLDNGTSGKE